MMSKMGVITFLILVSVISSFFVGGFFSLLVIGIEIEYGFLKAIIPLIICATTFIIALDKIEIKNE